MSALLPKLLQAGNRIIACLLVSSLGFAACDKFGDKEDQEPTVETVEDQLSEEQLTLLEALPVDSTTTLAQLYLPNGTTIRRFLERNDPGLLKRLGQKPNGTTASTTTAQEQINLFISRMAASGLYLTHRFEHTYPAGADPVKQPKQYGIAYGSGSKQYIERVKIGNGTCNRDLSLHALDCSGMIYQMTKEAQIEISKDPAGKAGDCGTGFLAKPSNWNDAFDASADYKKLQMVDKGQIPYTELQPGDIIVKAGSHIAFVGQAFAGQSSSGIILHSSGFEKPEPEKGRECLTNLTTKKGPTMNRIREKFLTDFFGTNYKILRPEPKCVEGGRITINPLLFNNKLSNGVVYKYAVIYMVTGGYPPYKVTSQNRNETGITCGDEKIIFATPASTFRPQTDNFRIEDSKGTVKDTVITVSWPN